MYIYIYICYVICFLYIQAPMMFFGDFGPTSWGFFPFPGLCGLAFAQGVQARGQTHDVKGLRRVWRSWEMGG